MNCTEELSVRKNSIFTLRYWQIVLVALIGSSLIYAAELSFTETPKFYIMVSALVLGVFIMAEAANIRLKKFPTIVKWLGLRLPLSMLLLGLVVGLSNLDDTYPIYFLGDFYVIAQFILIGLVFSLKGIDRYADKIFKGYLASLIIIYLSSFYFTYTRYYAEINRFAPPDTLLIITSAWFAFYRDKVLALVPLSFLLVMSAMCGFRFAFILAAFMVLLVLVASRRQMLSSRRIALAAAVSLILAMGLDVAETSSVRSVERVLKTYDAGYELALEDIHFIEALAVIQEQMEGPLINRFLGKGHGAFYKTYLSEIFWESWTPKGMHNIHVSPVLFFFRYGLIGLIWYLILFLYASKKAMEILFAGKREIMSDYRAISILYLFSLLLGSLMANNFTDMSIPVMFYLSASFKISAKENENAGK